MLHLDGNLDWYWECIYFFISICCINIRESINNINRLVVIFNWKTIWLAGDIKKRKKSWSRKLIQRGIREPFLLIRLRAMTTIKDYKALLLFWLIISPYFSSFVADYLVMYMVITDASKSDWKRCLWVLLKSGQGWRNFL